MAYEEINRQRRILSNNIEIAQQYHLRYSFDRTPEQTSIEELMNHIHKIENSARGKDNARANKNSPVTKECSKRTKRVAVKIPPNRSTSKAHPSPSSSPNSKEEDVNVTPLIQKRKRSDSE